MHGVPGPDVKSQKPKPRKANPRRGALDYLGMDPGLWSNANTYCVREVVVFVVLLFSCLMRWWVVRTHNY